MIETDAIWDAPRTTITIVLAMIAVSGFIFVALRGRRSEDAALRFLLLGLRIWSITILVAAAMLLLFFGVIGLMRIV